MEIVKKQNNRDSNFELLRIVSMSFIVLHHFLYHGIGLFNYLLGKSDSNYGVDVAIILNSFLIIGVNLFVMISGYYLIKLSSKSLIKIYLICAFYGFFTYITRYILIDGGAFKIQSALVRLFLPLSYPTYWFITHYVILMLLSPFINSWLKHAKQKQILQLILTLLVINVYFGFIRGEKHLDNGYNFIHFILIYIIGHYISLPDNKLISTFKSHSFLGWIISSISLSFIAFVIHFFDLPRKYLFMTFYYNNPIVIFSTVLLFISFSKLQIQSKIINWLSSSILAVYLIQEGGINFYKYIGNSFSYNGYNLNFILQILILFLVTMIFSILFDKLRLLITTPIENAINSRFNKVKF